MGADIDDTPASRDSDRLADAGRGARKSSTAASRKERSSDACARAEARARDVSFDVP
jgi:hypothetical protein